MSLRLFRAQELEPNNTAIAGRLLLGDIIVKQIACGFVGSADRDCGDCDQWHKSMTSAVRQPRLADLFRCYVKRLVGG